MMNILKEILREIKPSAEEEKEVRAKVRNILSKINTHLKNANAILGGSGIKETWLRQAKDADIFIKFNYKRYKGKSAELSDMLEKILRKKKLKIIRLHGSRDYFQVKEKNFTYELIPILDIKKAEKAVNITDVSPLHAKWVNKKGKKFKDEIRLLKQFCKAQGIYGAESYINGFSGYICEILTIYYKGFLNVLKNAAKWKEKEIIDAENYWKNNNILLELNKSKTNPPLIVIDPVQKDRNAAAAVSTEKFKLFKSKASDFIKKPSKKFFEIQKITRESLQKKAGKNTLIILEIKPKTGKVDVVGCKLLKALDFMRKELEKKDFAIISHGWQWNHQTMFYFIVKKQKLSDYIEWQGPPIKAARHVTKFRKKYKKTYIKNGKLYTKVKRFYKNPNELINSLKNNPYLKEKINNMKII
jgi:tRNA nucleotidyltransferase (CCA-adding enzyme)